MELKMSLWIVGPQSPCDMHTASKRPWVMKIWAEWHGRGQQGTEGFLAQWEWTTLAAIITWPVCCMNITQLYSFKKHHTRMVANSAFIMDLQDLFFFLLLHSGYSKSTLFSPLGETGWIHMQPAPCHSFWWHLCIGRGQNIDIILIPFLICKMCMWVLCIASLCVF